MGKNKYNVKIMDQEYNLVGEEGQDYYIDLAQKVDHIMREISKSNNRYSPNMIAVLTALNLADVLYKTQQEYSETSERLALLQGEMQKPFEELNSLNRELEAVKEQYTRIQSEYTKTQIELGKISREWAKAQEKMKDMSVELDVSRQTMDDMQNKLFENQIELLKVKKELDECRSKTGYDKKDRDYKSEYKTNNKANANKK